ncbi:hypothetical protein [Clostridium butyricum]|uniref:hypothetical protein n=1 Tax=Clostridium butyricum TaxID=1492 RepID=UPI0015F2DB82|nr:hypothetical protein [Clostridium butyricum]
MRKSFTTTIEENIQKNFKLSCVQNDVNMNDILEDLMKRYTSGDIKVDSKNDN